MSITEYARHRGVRLSAVQRAVAAGRITRAEDGSIDSEAADQEWAENTQHTQARPGPMSSHRASQPAAAPPTPQHEHALGLAGAQLPETAATFAHARSVREMFAARLVKLEFDTKTGLLLPREQVEATVHTLFHIVRDSLHNMPPRLAAQLAAESDANAVRDALDADIRAMLQELVASIGKKFKVEVEQQ